MVNADDARVLAWPAAGARRLVPFLRDRARGRGRRRPSSRRAWHGCADEGKDEALFALADVAAPRRAPAPPTSWPRPPRRACWARPPEPSPARWRAFRGVEHVLEHVAKVDGVDFYNDSKATNVDAARKSLEAFRGPCSLILGGRYKGGDFGDLAPALRATARRVLAIGEAQERIARSLREWCRWTAARRCARPWSARFARPRSPATSCCSPPPAPPSTCSATTPTAAAPSRTRCEARGHRGRRREGPWLRSSPPTSRSFAVTVALLGFGLVMVWSASLRPRPGAPRQRLPLPDQAGPVGEPRASWPWWRPCAWTTASCANPPWSTGWLASPPCCSSWCSSCGR